MARRSTHGRRLSAGRRISEDGEALRRADRLHQRVPRQGREDAPDQPAEAVLRCGSNAIMALSAEVRRVITTINKNDKAEVLLDGPTPHKKVRPQAQTVSRLLWVTHETPADLSSEADRAARRGLPPHHPAMHRTRTVDYAVVMSGEIDMLLDDSEIHLKAGDVLVQ